MQIKQNNNNRKYIERKKYLSKVRSLNNLWLIFGIDPTRFNYSIGHGCETHGLRQNVIYFFNLKRDYTPDISTMEQHYLNLTEDV